MDNNGNQDGGPSNSGGPGNHNNSNGPGNGNNNQSHMPTRNRGSDTENINTPSPSPVLLSAEEAAIRDRVLHSGYDTAFSQKPYSSNLVARLRGLGATYAIPAQISDIEAQYIDEMHRYYRDNVTGQGFNRNRHWPCSKAVLKWLDNLP